MPLVNVERLADQERLADWIHPGEHIQLKFFAHTLNQWAQTRQ